MFRDITYISYTGLWKMFGFPKCLEPPKSGNQLLKKKIIWLDEIEKIVWKQVADILEGSVLGEDSNA